MENEVIRRLTEENTALRRQLQLLQGERSPTVAQELQISMLFENIPLLINVLNSNFQYILWNQECERLLGYRADEMIDNPQAAELIYPDPAYRCEVRASLTQTAGYDYKPTLRRMTAKDGSVKLINWYNISRRCPIPGWHVWGFGIDVTEAQQQQQDLETLLENSPDAIVRVDTDLRYVYVNPTLSRLTDIPQQDFIGRTAAELGLPSYVSSLWDHHNRRLLATGEGFYLESAAFDRNGTLYYYSGQGVPEFGPDGKVRSILCTTRDITRQKKLEIALRRQQQEFAALVENAPDVIARIDPNGCCVYANPAAEKITGLRQEQILGRRIVDIASFSKRFIQLFEQYFSQVVESKQHGRFEHEYVQHDELHYLDNQLIPELTTDGSIESILFLSRDVTPYRRMTMQLARLDRLNLVGEMAASIGHEVRNPMTTVRGFLQLLGAKPEYQPHHDFFQLMIEELDRANSIISEFLSLAKDKTVHLEINNLNSILMALLPLLQAGAIVDKKSIAIDLQPLPDILLDEKEIRQLVLNLSRNAIESMQPGQTLTLQTYHENHSIVLAVHDQGHGIPEEILKQLGTPFLSTKEQGTGLGLAVCYSIAERHNASIQVKTGSSGTSFFVFFPCS